MIHEETEKCAKCVEDSTKTLAIPLDVADLPGIPAKATVEVRGLFVEVDIDGDGDVDVTHDYSCGATFGIAPQGMEYIPRTLPALNGWFHHRPTREGFETNIVPAAEPFDSASRSTMTPREEMCCEIRHAARVLKLFAPIGSIDAPLSWNELAS